MNKKILVIMGRYLPGYKGGGPGLSISNLVSCLGDQYDFYVSCYDRDYGEKETYKNIEYNEWNSVGKAKVWYIPEEKGYTFKELKKLINGKDIIYLCGCFNDYAIKTLVMNKLGKVKIPVVIAAMGLFSPLAFKIKYTKKHLFSKMFSCLGMFDNIYWSVTSDMEAQEIKQEVKSKRFVYYVAQDLPRVVDEIYPIKDKEKNKIKIVFLSRIARKKNLQYALEVIRKIDNDISVEFDIYGPIEDEVYWTECVDIANELPTNINWKYKGAIESKNVIEVLRRYQVFLFPTLGENYGHVIQEALSAGCLCIISDQTPWKDFEKEQVGAVLSLDNIVMFSNKIYEIAKIGQEEFQELSRKAIQYSIKVSKVDSIADGYKNMFNSI